MCIADMLSCAYLQLQSSTCKADYQLNQEARLYKEIENIDPAMHVQLSENGLEEGRHPQQAY